MFGLFQANLSIGSRLWVAFLALAAGGAWISTSLSPAISNPGEFVTNLLILYGQATAFEFFFSLVLTIAYLMVDEFILSPRKARLHPFYVATERPVLWFDRTVGFLSPFVFVAAIIWSADRQIDPRLASGGFLLLLLSEIYKSNSFNRDAYEFASIKQKNQRKTLDVQLTSRRIKQSYRLRADWMEIIVFLCDNRWEIIEIANERDQEVLHSALLKRKYQRKILNEILPRKSLLPKEYLDPETE